MNMISIELEDIIQQCVSHTNLSPPLPPLPSQDYGNPVASSLKWGNLFKLLKRHSQSALTAELLGLPEQVIMDAQEIIAYHVNSTKPLSR